MDVGDLEETGVEGGVVGVHDAADGTERRKKVEVVDVGRRAGKSEEEHAALERRKTREQPCTCQRRAAFSVLLKAYS